MPLRARVVALVPSLHVCCDHDEKDIVVDSRYYQRECFRPHVVAQLSSERLSAKTKWGTRPRRTAGEVVIARDAHGRPVIEALDEWDMARALGFIHAQERFFQMDLLRRISAGELAALFGSGLISHDESKAKFALRNHSRDILTRLPEQQRLRLEAYADGVNAGISALRSRPIPYLLLRQTPQSWLPEDSILVAFAKYFTLQDGFGNYEHTRLISKRYFPASLQQLLFTTPFRMESPLLGEAPQPASLPFPDAADWQAFVANTADLQANASFRQQEPYYSGSNSWAVSGAFTPHGLPILSNDMHLEQGLPSIWYRARLVFQRDGRSVDVSGVTLPGIPGVIVGATDQVAWGFTNSNIFTTSLIPLPDDLPVTTREVSIRVANSEDILTSVSYTEYGPVLSFQGDSQLYVLQWLALLPCGINLDLVDMEIANNVDEALAIAHRAGVPTQNFLVVDAEGNMAWTLIGGIADRTTNGFWQGRLPAEQYPSLINPESGLLWTANNRIALNEWLAVIGESRPAEDGRAFAIAEALHGSNQFDERDLLRIQLLNRTPVLDAWQTVLLEDLADSSDPQLIKLHARVAQWSGSAQADDVAHEIINRFRARFIQLLSSRIYGPLQTRYPHLNSWAANLETAAFHILQNRHQDWVAAEFGDGIREIYLSLLSYRSDLGVNTTKCTCNIRSHSQYHNWEDGSTPLRKAYPETPGHPTRN
ncbi:MAG: penicillin acylase family protein [Verrucomicrobia bacterium]|nr:penicillin acylase family protein [Verrucomicrobiota bacterium]